MKVNFSEGLANAADFPATRIFAAPRLTAGQLRWNKNAVDTRKILLTSNGRNAIAIAAKKMQKPTGVNRVLIPAYHCPALIEPFSWAGYEVYLYPVRPDLSTDLQTLTALAHQHAITHGVVIRYFGFSQNSGDAIETMRGLGLTVLEDCAHALFEFIDDSEGQERRGHYRICSLNKFLPTTEGGAVSPITAGSEPLQRPPVIEIAKSTSHLFSLNRARQASKAPKNMVTRSKPLPKASLTLRSSQYRYFDPGTMWREPGPQTKLLFAHANLRKIAAARRHTFIKLHQAVCRSPLGRPLYDTLDGGVPYVFPFLLEKEEHFSLLRKAGIQALRWEELADSGCNVSWDYRRRLVQLPCHHELNNDDQAYIAAVFNGEELP